MRRESGAKVSLLACVCVWPQISQPGAVGVYVAAYDSTALQFYVVDDYSQASESSSRLCRLYVRHREKERER